MPQTCSGGLSPKAQDALSRLWISCWAVWSPDSQLKWYQFHNLVLHLAPPRLPLADDVRARRGTFPGWPRCRRWRRRAPASSSPAPRDRTASRARRPGSALFLRSSPAAMDIFSPGMSRPCGFSQKTCLPASTAALSITGMKCDAGAISTTSTPLAISFFRRRSPQSNDRA